VSHGIRSPLIAGLGRNNDKDQRKPSRRSMKSETRTRETIKPKNGPHTAVNTARIANAASSTGQRDQSERPQPNRRQPPRQDTGLSEKKQKRQAKSNEVGTTSLPVAPRPPSSAPTPTPPIATEPRQGWFRRRTCNRLAKSPIRHAGEKPPP
jgi:hypothetical protein